MKYVYAIYMANNATQQKKYWCNTGGYTKQAQSIGKGKGHIVQLEAQLYSIQSQMDTMILVLATYQRIH